MFKHFLVSALRHFIRHKIVTTINLLCLVIGIAGFLGAHLVATFLDSADSYFPNAGRVFTINQTVEIKGSGIPTGTMIYTAWQAANYLRTDLPQLVVARTTFPEKTSVLAGDTKLAMQVKYTEAEFFDLFALTFIAGDAKTALRQPRSVVLTEAAAQRLFGNSQSALGQRLVLENSVDVEVVGVIDNVRRPSHLQAGAQDGFDMLVSMDVFERDVLRQRSREDWTRLTVMTYVMLPGNGAVTRYSLQRELASFGNRYVPVELCICRFSATPLYELSLTNLNAVVGTDRTGVSARTLLYLLGDLVLLVACVNYANLATAQAAVRAKEVGMRCIMGASRPRIMLQFLFEAALLASAALLIVITLLAAVLAITGSAETSLVLRRLFGSGEAWIGACLLLCVTTLTAGAYPAFFLSRVKPTDAVRVGQTRMPPRLLTRALIGVQFASASFLLIAVLVMSTQNANMKRSTFGSEGDTLVVLRNDIRTAQVSMDALRAELLRQPHIKSVTAYFTVPWDYFLGFLRVSGSQEEGAPFRLVLPNRVEYDFFQTLEMKRLAGRVFDREHSNDISVWRETKSANVVIDRALAEQQGWFDPQQAMGKTLYLKGAALDREVLPRPLTIIGVVEGRPLGVLGLGATSNVYFLEPQHAVVPIIRIDASNVPMALAEIDATWKALAPKEVVERQFSGELLGATYAVFGRVAAAITAISILALISAVLGLVGMSIYLVGRRTHEIGIRKTLGATSTKILVLLLRDFSRPIVIANLIAWPLAFVAMRFYLRMFTDRSALSLMPFVVSTALTLAVALAAIATQALKAARLSPVEVLRYE